jgi:cysteine-rich repeat protein
MRLFPRIAALPLLLAACPAEPPIQQTDESSSSGDESTSTGETPTSTGDEATSNPTDTGTTGPDETSSTTTGTDDTGPVPPPICGNGIPEGDELCDDGNDDPEDGCDKLCELTGNQIWTQSWDSGQKRDDVAWGVVIDADGDIYVAGTVENTDDYSDAVVRKLDKDGNELDTFTYAGQLGLDDGGRGVALGAGGSVLLCGYEVLIDEGPEQGFVRKFTADGETEWTYTRMSMYPEGFSVFHAVIADGDAIFAAGVEEIENNIYQGFVERLDPDDGQPIWTALRPETEAFSMHGLAFTPDGDVLLASSLPGNSDDAKPLIARLAADDGAEVWVQSYPGTGYARGVAANADGDIAATGFVRGDNGDGDIWTARMTADGELVWSDKYDRDGKADVGSAVGWSSAGDIYIGGYAIANTLNDVFVRRFTGDGEAYWTNFYNDAIDLYDVVNGIAVSDEMVVAVGSENVSGSGTNMWIRAYEP